MLGIFKKYKKIWLIGILIVVVVVLVLLFIFIREKMGVEEVVKIEEAIEKGMEECRTDFDLEKLDFTKPVWESELPTILKEILVLRAVSQNNRALCNYEEKEINLGLQKVRCERDYDFYFTLTEKLEKGIDSQQYVKECQEAMIPNLLIEAKERNIEMPEDIDVLKEGTGNACESYYQSFQNKTPVILEPALMCDEISSSYDVVNYFDPQSNQTKSCLGEHSEKIKFLIAIAKNNPADCLTIEDFRASRYCRFYFDRDSMIFYDEFKEAYCHNLVQNVLIPDLLQRGIIHSE